MKILKVILIPIIIVVLLAGMFFVTIDGVKDLVTQSIGKIIEILSDTNGVKTFARQKINSILNAFGVNKFILPGSDEYIVVIDDNTFKTVKNGLQDIINTKASGYEDITIKKMLLIYYTSVCTSDTKILITINDDEFQKFNDEEADDSPYEAVEIAEAEINGVEAGKYLQTNGIIHIYLDGTEEMKYLSDSNINSVIGELKTKTNLIGAALGTFYGIDKLGTIKLYTSTDKTTNKTTEYDGDTIDALTGDSESVTLDSSGVTFDYSMYTSDYVIPMELLADFLNFTGSPDFIDKFAKLQENSYINLGIYKTSVETIETDTTNYDYKIDLEVYQEKEVTDVNGVISTERNDEWYYSEIKSIEESKVITKKMYNYEMQLMEVDNWFAHIVQNNTLQETTTYESWNSNGELVEISESDKDNLTKVAKNELNEEVNGIDRRTTDTIFQNAIGKELDGIKRQVRNNGYTYIDWVHANYHKINTTQSKLVQTNNKYLQTSTPTKEDNTDKFLALLSTESGIYNEDDVNNGKFLSKASGGKVVKYKDIYNGETGVGEMLENGAETFFQLLEDSLDQDNNDIGSNTQGLLDIMKYIMWRYSGIDYGVTDFDFISTFSNSLIGVSGSILGNTTEEKLWYTLKAAGLSDAAVAAAMGNIYAESSMNPTLVEYGYNENNGGIGLCQWTNGNRGTTGRNTQLKKYAASKGTTWKDENIQIEFLLTELGVSNAASGFTSNALSVTTYTGTRYDPQTWSSAKEESDIEAATKAFCFTFERPSVRYARISVRIDAAKNYYKKYSGKTLNVGNISSYASDQYYGVYTSSKGKTYISWTQWTDRYANIPLSGFSGSTLKSSGCHVTSWAIVLSGYGITISPQELNARIPNSGSDASIQSTINSLGLSASIVRTSVNKNKVKQLLKEGKPVIIYGKASDGFKYARTQHFITLVDINEAGNQIYVLNPSSSDSSKSGWQSEYDVFHGASTIKYLQ